MSDSARYSAFLHFSFIAPPTPISTLFPYTTLFRSQANHHVGARFSANNADLDDVKEDEQEFSFTSSRSALLDRKSTRLNSSHVEISYAVFCLKKKKHMGKSK